MSDILVHVPDEPVAAAAPEVRSAGARRRVTVGGAIVAAIIAIVVLWALVPGPFTSQDPLSGDPAERFTAPGGAHWFGTDELGRDVFARVVHGTRLTLSAAGLAVAIGLVGGTLLGLAAATFRGVVDATTMRIVDVLLAIPGFLLALCLVAAVGPSTYTVGVAIGIASIATFARLMRSEVLRVREFDFVEAAYLNGFSRLRTMFREILPNSVGPVLALVAIEVSASIILISALGFLGYGNPPPQPEWGVIVADGRSYLGTAWWITTLPGIVLVVTVAAFARLSRRLQRWRSL